MNVDGKVVVVTGAALVVDGGTVKLPQFRPA